MKFYSVTTHTSHGQPCDSYAMAIAENERIEDHVGHRDKVSQITQADWEANRGFRQVCSNKAKHELMAMGLSTR